MKNLVESLFDTDLIEKDLFTDPVFKKWINRPDVLWYIYYYWADDMEDMLKDFMRNEWSKYKDIVDVILNIINDRCKRLNFQSWYDCSYDQYEFSPQDKRYDQFNEESEFYDEIGFAMDEVKRKSTDEYDGIWKTWFSGSFPKNSEVTYFVEKLYPKGVKSGLVDGGIFLTNQDTIIVMTFPKGIDKSILKLFNLK